MTEEEKGGRRGQRVHKTIINNMQEYNRATNANKAAYTELAEASAKVFRANGALSVVETWGVSVPDGKVTSFPMAVKLEKDESVVFSWITWPDKETADAAMEPTMKELEQMMGGDMSKMPFDGMRMIWGGFETIVEA